MNSSSLTDLLKRYQVKVVLQQLLKLAPPKPKLMLPVHHSIPPRIGFAPNVEPSKSYPLFLGALQRIKKFLHGSYPILKFLRLRGTIVHRQVRLASFLNMSELSSMGALSLSSMLLCSYSLWHWICSFCFYNSSRSSRFVMSPPIGEWVSSLRLVFPLPFPRLMASSLSKRLAVGISSSLYVL